MKNNSSIENLFNQAIKNHQTSKYEQAIKLYKQILAINENIAAVHNNIGLIYYSYKKFNLALKFYKNALKIDNKFIEAHNNIAIIYEKLEQFENAIFHCQEAIKINPEFSKPYNNLGSIYEELGEFKKAVSAYKKSCELQPDSIEALNNLGSIYRYLGFYEKAISYYNAAIKIDNNYIKAKKNLGLVHLLLSNFKKGFEEFEWRILEKDKEEYRNLNIKSSLWKGENLDGKTILILSEQGLGDVIQFSRYIFYIKKKYNVKIIFKTYKKLLHLFFNSKIDLIVGKDKIPNHDYHIYLMSLMKFHYFEEKKLLKEYDFIKSNYNLFLKWKKKLSKIKSIKIGINWQGGKKFKADKIRSIPLIYFENLFDIKGIEFISLQKDSGLQQLSNFKFKNKIHNFSSIVDNRNNAFEDTIEIIKNLDLVITSCTSIAHLSSTMGKKTWILLNLHSDWRWFLKSKNTVWYKNTELIRQKKEGDWEEVFKIVKEKIIKDFNL